MTDELRGSLFRFGSTVSVAFYDVHHDEWICTMVRGGISARLSFASFVRIYEPASVHAAFYLAKAMHARRLKGCR